MKSLVRHLALAVVLFSLGCAGPRTVVPGRLYMSGQPDGRQCDRWVRKLGLRSVVNLRGVDETRTSYQEEKDCTERAGLQRLDLPFSASGDPPRYLLERYIRRFPALPEPVLIHCQAGVDRSSLGVFLALMLWDYPFEEAASWVRSPLKHPCLRNCPQKQFVRAFESWCAGQDRAPDRKALLDYVEHAYCPEEFRYAIETAEPPAEAVPGGPVRCAVRVTNSGSRPWALSAETERGVRLGVRLYGPLTALPADPEAYYYNHHNEGWDACRAGMEEGVVAVGESRDWVLAFGAPAVPGLYLMAVDMVEEHRAWFSDYGRPPRLSLLRVGTAPHPCPPRSRWPTRPMPWPTNTARAAGRSWRGGPGTGFGCG